MAARINDSRIVQHVAELLSIAAALAELVEETQSKHPEASAQLMEVLAYVTAARRGLKETVDWPVPLP
jgi:hypothetical protein